MWKYSWIVFSKNFNYNLSTTLLNTVRTIETRCIHFNVQPMASSPKRDLESRTLVITDTLHLTMVGHDFTTGWRIRSDGLTQTLGFDNFHSNNRVRTKLSWSNKVQFSFRIEWSSRAMGPLKLRIKPYKLYGVTLFYSVAKI